MVKNEVQSKGREKTIEILFEGININRNDFPRIDEISRLKNSLLFAIPQIFLNYSSKLSKFLKVATFDCGSFLVFF